MTDRENALNALREALEKFPLNTPRMTMARSVINYATPRQAPKAGQFDFIPYRGKSLMEWAVEWFSTSNDDFYALHGFNFNPHEWAGLYEAARERVYGSEA